jgi:hypothetical protein
MRTPFAKKYVKDVKNIQKKLNFGRNNLTEEQKKRRDRVFKRNC